MLTALTAANFAGPALGSEVDLAGLRVLVRVSVALAVRKVPE